MKGTMATQGNMFAIETIVRNKHVMLKMKQP